MNISKNSLVLGFLLSSLVLILYGNSFLIFKPETAKVQKFSDDVIVDRNLTLPIRFKEGIQLELSKDLLLREVKGRLPEDACFVAEIDGNNKVKTEIVSLNPTEQLTPGSTLKVLTSAIVLSIFDKDETLDTSLYGKSKNGIVQNAVLEVSGDPSFVSDPQPDLLRPSYIQNKDTHTFDELAKEISKKNISKIVNLDIDSTWFQLDTTNPEWKSKNSQVGALGSLLVNEGYESKEVSKEPILHAANQLKQVFSKYSIEVGSINIVKTIDGNNTLDKTELIGMTKSAPIEKLISNTLKTSNNIYAEQLLIAAAHKKNGNVTQSALTKFMDDESSKLISNNKGLKYLNGSGFSYNAKISCNQEMEIIQSMHSKKIDILDLASKANIDGTLTERFKKYRGILKAKTGTLDGISSLVGQLNTIEFVVIVNGQFSNSKGHEYQEIAVDELNQFPSVKNLML